VPRPEKRRRPARISFSRRAGSWLNWWVLLMSFWVILDDSLDTDELLAGAAAAAIGAFLAELASYQAATRFRLRIDWASRALGLPAQVARDTFIVFWALWRRLANGEEPRSGFSTEPVRYGTQTADGKTRRALLVGAMSLAPNSFALGLDPDRDEVVVHKLVLPADRPQS
jgi:multisubunit Na+/H+ antiporter MnhE subunit